MSVLSHPEPCAGAWGSVPWESPQFLWGRAANPTVCPKRAGVGGVPSGCGMTSHLSQKELLTSLPQVKVPRGSRGAEPFHYGGEACAPTRTAHRPGCGQRGEKRIPQKPAPSCVPEKGKAPGAPRPAATTASLPSPLCREATECGPDIPPVLAHVWGGTWPQVY